MDYSKKHEISVYLTEEQLNQRIAEIGAQITERFKGESVYLVCILKGSIFFTTELAKRIALPMTIDFISASSYGAQTHSSGVVNIKKDLEQSIEGENVIVVEDIGFVIPDKFVVGFGLDYDQRYRNLPYIGFVEDAD